MSCHFTEEVSLLVDGELAPQEAARLGAHIEGCAACQQAREAFLLFRQELRAYSPDTHAQSRALASILNSHTSEGEEAASRVSTWLGNLAEAFSVSHLRPAHVTALALLLIGTVLGVRWFMSSDTSSRTTQSDAPAVANANSQPVPAEAIGKSSQNSDAVHNPPVHVAKTPQPHRPTFTASNPRKGREEARSRHQAGQQRREGSSRDSRTELARVFEPTLRPSTDNVVAPFAAENVRAAADPALRLGRHAERVERLLRSFRNARLTQSDSTLDVADARRLSKRLLYNNIALRREAASSGDLPVEGLLDSVEPILLDISNLPNVPSQEAVGSIKERIRKRQLVGVLQAQGMLASY
jgi:hypothetical protein